MTGFVAFLDVLGFAALVSRDGPTRATTTYRDLIANTLGAFPSVEYVVFSDSIVLTVSGSGRSDAVEILKCCSAFFYAATMAGIPLRGAVAHGAFEKSTKGSHGVIVVGAPIIEAYQYEQRQDWVGILLAPSCLDVIGDLPQQLGHHPWCVLLREAQIPFHGSEELFHGAAVLPLPAGSIPAGAVAGALNPIVNKLHDLAWRAPDPSAQQKHMRAKDWVNSARNQIGKQLTRGGLAETWPENG